MLEPPLAPIIAFLDFVGLFALAALPIVVVLVCRMRASEVHFGQIIFSAGVIFALHTLLMFIWLWQLESVPMLLDPCPFDRIIDATLNWALPLTYVGATLAAIVRPTVLRRRSYWAGATLIIASSVAFAWRSHCFLIDVGTSLSKSTWWM